MKHGNENQGEGNREADRRYRKGVRKTVEETTDHPARGDARAMTNEEREEALEAETCQETGQFVAGTRLALRSGTKDHCDTHGGHDEQEAKNSERDYCCAYSEFGKRAGAA